MAITRSGNKQSHIEDFPTTKPKSTAKRASKSSNEPTESTTSTKRTAPSSESTQQSPPKMSKASKSRSLTGNQKEMSTTDSSEVVFINRAPVLHLWGACVAHTQHPDLSWQTCLNAGSAISTLCAMSKGKAIGMIERKDRSPDEKAKKEEGKEKAKAGANRVDVMGFDLPMKGEAVILSDKEVNVKELNLLRKFGGKHVGDGRYASVKGTMEEALERWKGREEELGKKAFHMYESFRPNVPKGEQGWGRKGMLRLEDLKSVVYW